MFNVWVIMRMASSDCFNSPLQEHVSLGLLGPDVACTIFEVPIGSTSVYVEQDTPDQNLLGKKKTQTGFKENTKIKTL